MWLTVFKRHSGTERHFYAPFNLLIQAKEQPEIYRSLLMNVFLFFPVGLSLPFVFDKRQIILTVLLAFAFSVAIETIQYAFAIGNAEADDVICNTIGAFIGSVSFVIARKNNA